MKIFVFELVDNSVMPSKRRLYCICSFSQAGALRLAENIAGCITLGMCFYEDESLSSKEQIARLECSLNKGLIPFYNDLIWKLKRGSVRLQSLNKGLFESFENFENF